MPKAGAKLNIAVDFSGYGGLTYEGTGFPVAVDLVVTPLAHLDRGLSFAMPLLVEDPGAYLQSALFVRVRLRGRK